MKNKGWYDEMWNPITGSPRPNVSHRIKNHCQRFSGDIRMNLGLINMYSEIRPGYYDLNYPVISQGSDKHFLIAPFGTAPTFHKYRLDTPETKYRTGRNLYVNAYADTFDMPREWLDEVFLRIRNNSRHNFILISDNWRMMEEYIEFRSYMMCDNLWLGFQVTERAGKVLSRIQINTENSHFFIAVDEITTETVMMLETFVKAPGSMARNMEWILVSEAIGSNKHLLTRIAEIADSLSIPVYFETEGADLPRVLPKAFMRHKLSDKKKASTWANCARCGAELPKAAMYRIGWTKGRGCSSTILGFLCEDCFEKYQANFPSF